MRRARSPVAVARVLKYRWKRLKPILAWSESILGRLARGHGGQGGHGARGKRQRGVKVALRRGTGTAGTARQSQSQSQTPRQRHARRQIPQHQQPAACGQSQDRVLLRVAASHGHGAVCRWPWACCLLPACGLPHRSPGLARSSAIGFYRASTRPEPSLRLRLPAPACARPEGTSWGSGERSSIHLATDVATLPQHSAPSAPPLLCSSMHVRTPRTQTQHARRTPLAARSSPHGARGVRPTRALASPARPATSPASHRAGVTRTRAGCARGCEGAGTASWIAPRRGLGWP